MKYLLVENLSISHWLSDIWFYVILVPLYFFQIHTPKRPYYEMNTCVVKKDEKICHSITKLHSFAFFHFRKQINNFLILWSRIISFHFLFVPKKSCFLNLFIFVCLWKTVQIGFLLFQKGFHFPKGFNLVSTLLMNLDKNKNEFSPRVPS